MVGMAMRDQRAVNRAPRVDEIALGAVDAPVREGQNRLFHRPQRVMQHFDLARRKSA
jgi:hypothetical protein